MRRFVSRRTFAFALTLAVALLVAEAIAQPSFFDPGNASGELATFAPFAILAMASTPAILAGGGGIDLSVGPLATVVNCIFVIWLLPHGFGGAVSVPVMLAIGAAVGAVNGVLVAILRYQPVIATLCALFILAGLADKIAPNPTPAPHSWMVHLAGNVAFLPGALLTIAFPLLVWLALRRTAFHRLLLSVGGDDAAAFSAGVDVTKVRIAAYSLGGLFAAARGYCPYRSATDLLGGAEHAIRAGRPGGRGPGGNTDRRWSRRNDRVVAGGAMYLHAPAVPVVGRGRERLPPARVRRAPDRGNRAQHALSRDGGSRGCGMMALHPARLCDYRAGKRPNRSARRQRCTAYGSAGSGAGRRGIRLPRSRPCSSCSCGDRRP